MSGIIFDCSKFKRHLEDVEKDVIGTVIVKGLPWLGRLNSMASY